MRSVSLDRFNDLQRWRGAVADEIFLSLWILNKLLKFAYKHSPEVNALVESNGTIYLIAPTFQKVYHKMNHGF